MPKAKPTEAVVGPYGIKNTETHSSPHTFVSSGANALEGDGMCGPERLRPLSIEIRSLSDDEMEMEFDLIGTSAPIANTLRRVMLEDVPTVAIEIVDFHFNSSVLQDENLAGRIGLVPLKVDPSALGFPSSAKWRTDPRECLKFKLDVSGTWMSQPVYSNAFQWVPLNEEQKNRFEKNPPKPVHGDILIAKLKPGQRIHADLYACKGTGTAHAKYSPVCPVAYRMHPKVQLCDPDGHPVTISGAEAQAIQKLCPANVFAIEDGHLAVKNERACTVCRECIRESGATAAASTGPSRQQCIRLVRAKDHFIFTVESSGVYTAPEIVRQALQLLQHKCKDLQEIVKDVTGVMGKKMDLDEENDIM